MKTRNHRKSQFAKRAKRGFKGYPIATIAFYGPDEQRASKLAVGIVFREDAEPDILKRWHSGVSDLRYDHDVGEEVKELLREHQVKSVAALDRIIGCPHEEGVDYAEGGFCPECPYWRGRNRWTGETIN